MHFIACSAVISETEMETLYDYIETLVLVFLLQSAIKCEVVRMQFERQASRYWNPLCD